MRITKTNHSTVKTIKAGKRVTASPIATKQLSPNDQAVKHIKAAIDILGKSGNKDEVTKDSIANLATVMFDIEASKK